MVRAREDRIRTFMQLELEACLEEVSWSIKCYNCEVLGCPQEEYPARLLPTLPPDYEDNLINRLRTAQKGILPASLKMILNPDYQLPVLRSASQVSVQPDSVIGEHRVEQHSTASECDLSPRHAAVVTRSEKLETPPKSPAISTRLHRPGVSPAFEADSPQTDESLFPFEASTDDFLDKNVTSTKQEEPALLHQQHVGVDDGEKETTQQAAVRKEFVSPTEKQQQKRMATWSTDESKQFDRGRLMRCKIPFSREIFCLYYCTVVYLCLFLSVCICFVYSARISYFSRFATEAQVRRRYEPFGCAGCVSCCINEHSPSRFFANQGYFFAYSTSLYVYIFSLIDSVMKSLFKRS